MKNYVRHVGFFSSAQAIYGILTFFYTLFAARLLGLRDFGLFQALLGFYSLTLSIALPLNFGALHCVASAEKNQKKNAAGEFLLCSILLCVLFFILFFFLIRPINHALYIQSPGPAWNLTLLVMAAFLLACLFGIQQGFEDYAAYSWAKLAQGILCLVGGGILLFTGFGVSGALAGYSLSMIAVFIFLIAREKIHPWHWRFFHVKKEMPAILAITGIFWSILAVDNLPAIMARRLLGLEDSGYFAALYNLRNTVWPFMFAIVIPFYSGFVSGTAGKKEFRLSLGMLALLGCGFTAAGLILPEFLIRTFYGASYAGAAPYMAMYGVVLFFQMMTWLFFFYLAAAKKLRMSHLTWPVIIFFAGIVLFERSIQGLMLAQGSAYFLGWMMSLVDWFRLQRGGVSAEKRA